MKASYGVTFLTFALLAALPVSPEPAQPAEPVEPVTVVFVRHAEKVSATERDPALSEAGRERAVDLAELFSAAGVTHLYSSEFVRTRTTLAPLAEELALEVEVVPAGDHADQVAAIEALSPGSLAVVAGHSNTVPRLVHELGGSIPGLEEHPRYGPMLADDEYDRLFILTLPAGDQTAVRTLELRYGDR